MTVLIKYHIIICLLFTMIIIGCEERKKIKEINAKLSNNNCYQKLLNILKNKGNGKIDIENIYTNEKYYFIKKYGIQVLDLNIFPKNIENTSILKKTKKDSVKLSKIDTIIYNYKFMHNNQTFENWLLHRVYDFSKGNNYIISFNKTLYETSIEHITFIKIIKTKTNKYLVISGQSFLANSMKYSHGGSSTLYIFDIHKKSKKVIQFDSYHQIGLNLLQDFNNDGILDIAVIESYLDVLNKKCCCNFKVVPYTIKNDSLTKIYPNKEYWLDYKFRNDSLFIDSTGASPHSSKFVLLKK